MTRILVVGAGATGGYFGARLTQASRDVTFLVRPRRAAQLAATGLRVTTPAGHVEVHPKVVTASELAGPYDLVLLAVKGDALEGALEDVAPAIGPHTVIVPFLNGIDHLVTIDAYYPGALLGAVVMVAAQLDEGGSVAVSVPTSSIEIGEFSGEETPRLLEVAAALGDAGFGVRLSTHILTAMWHKWVLIAAGTTITCLAGGTIGDVAAVQGGKAFADTVLEEIAAISGAAGHPLPDTAYLGLQATLTQEGLPFAPSTYRDVKQGRPTEVEHVLGSLARTAKLLKIPVPLLNAAIVRLRVHNQATATQPEAARRTPATPAAA
ncbi:ketopantoate reductase family protein [Streptomyces chartreusis]|uniref:ketopantoate reductase family protein n=1 Tax=Streptomyces chartreusis TaxID=1969 RepID=UPI00363F213A